MKSRPAKVLKYLDMGPWPVFVGLCFDERAYHREMERINVKDPGSFLSPRAAATLHTFHSNSQTVYLLALGPVKGLSKEAVAALVAHEATHIIQYMQADLAGGRSLGGEAEAYLVQMIVQEALQHLWKSNRVRRKEPVA